MVKEKEQSLLLREHLFWTQTQSRRKMAKSMLCFEDRNKETGHREQKEEDNEIQRDTKKRDISHT